MNFTRSSILITFLVYLCADSPHLRAECVTFGPGIQRGIVGIRSLREASGIAASRRNTGVLWTHNDGSGGVVYALSATGAHLATFYLNRTVMDTEDIAVGPGPVSGSSYLYLGDIGGNNGRRQVQILRIPEPFVDSRLFSNPPSSAFSGVNTFTLVYPDGIYDAETLMVDPISQDLFIIAKGDTGARVYRTNLTNQPNGSTVWLAFVRAVPFAKASGGDISADGTLIVLRRENAARVWNRMEGESVGSALSRDGRRIPVVGPPMEENGEGIALLPNGKGYVTISEGENPVLYFFRALCPSPPEFTVLLTDKTALVGHSIAFRAKASGFPSPHYRWFFNGEPLPRQRRNTLILRHVEVDQAGEYTVTVSNRYGNATSTATLDVTER